MKSRDPDLTEYATFTTSSMVLLVVGGPYSPSREAEAKEFHVHQDILVDASPAFEAMLRKRPSSVDVASDSMLWLEAATRRVVLPKDRAEDWARMIHWLYTESLVGNSFRPHHLIKPCRNQLLTTLQICQPGLDDQATFNAIKVYLRWKHRSIHSKRAYRGLRDETLAAKLQTSLGKPGMSRDVKAEDSQLARALVTKEVRCPHRHESKRPDPPAFGALVRLAVLGDKYGIGLQGDSGLQQQIALRIKAVAKLSSAVPNQEDVKMLYGIPITKHPVKTAVVECYNLLKDDTFQRLLGRTKYEVIAGVQDDWPLEFLLHIADLQGTRALTA